MGAFDLQLANAEAIDNCSLFYVNKNTALIFKYSNNRHEEEKLELASQFYAKFGIVTKSNIWPSPMAQETHCSD